MCIGTPMRVIERDGSFAWCESDQHRERLDMMLVGDQPLMWLTSRTCSQGIEKYTAELCSVLKHSPQRPASAFQST